MQLTVAIKVERGGGGGGTISNGRACSGVMGVLLGGGGEMDKNRVRLFYLERTTSATFGTGG